LRHTHWVACGATSECRAPIDRDRVGGSPPAHRRDRPCRQLTACGLGDVGNSIGQVCPETRLAPHARDGDEGQRSVAVPLRLVRAPAVQRVRRGDGAAGAREDHRLGKEPDIHPVCGDPKLSATVRSLPPHYSERQPGDPDVEVPFTTTGGPSPGSSTPAGCTTRSGRPGCGSPTRGTRKGSR
jgi:hypothetical protein